MAMSLPQPSLRTPLLTRMRSFCLPGGEKAATSIRAVRTMQRGEIRMSPEARWITFTAEETTETTHSRFRWEAASIRASQAGPP